MLDDLHDRDNALRLHTLLRECLTSREAEIIRLRYGLGGTVPLTQREIASSFGISRSYVSRIEKRALEKLRTALQSPPPPRSHENEDPRPTDGHSNSGTGYIPCAAAADPSIPPHHRSDLPHNRGIGAVNGTVILILRREPSLPVPPGQPLYRGLVLQEGHYDLAVAGRLLAAYHHQIPGRMPAFNIDSPRTRRAKYSSPRPPVSKVR